jgi:cytidine deaminase
LSGSEQNSWPETERRKRNVKRSGPDRRTDAGWIPVMFDNPAGSEGTLVAAATAARLRAQADYSGFKVGAAFELPDGSIISGCNIENASYSLTICAERVALVKALSDGHTTFVRLAVVADTEAPTPPCGPCRQLLWEYCGDIEVILANLGGPVARHQLATLLPLPFDRRLLK